MIEWLLGQKDLTKMISLSQRQGGKKFQCKRSFPASFCLVQTASILINITWIVEFELWIYYAEDQYLTNSALGTDNLIIGSSRESPAIAQVDKSNSQLRMKFYQTQGLLRGLSIPIRWSLINYILVSSIPGPSIQLGATEQSINSLGI